MKLFTISLFLIGIIWFGTGTKADPRQKVLLSQVTAITLNKGQWTTGRRGPNMKQLNCVGGTGADGAYEPDTVQCIQTGFDGIDAQWKCTDPNMPGYYKFGRMEVVCEGYEYPTDPFILKGSCGLEYELIRFPGVPTWTTNGTLCSVSDGPCRMDAVCSGASPFCPTSTMHPDPDECQGTKETCPPSPPMYRDPDECHTTNETCPPLPPVYRDPHVTNESCTSSNDFCPPSPPSKEVKSDEESKGWRPVEDYAAFAKRHNSECTEPHWSQPPVKKDTTNPNDRKKGWSGPVVKLATQKPKPTFYDKIQDVSFIEWVLLIIIGYLCVKLYLFGFGYVEIWFEYCFGRDPTPRNHTSRKKSRHPRPEEESKEDAKPTKKNKTVKKSYIEVKGKKLIPTTHRLSRRPSAPPLSPRRSSPTTTEVHHHHHTDSDTSGNLLSGLFGYMIGSSTSNSSHRSPPPQWRAPPVEDDSGSHSSGSVWGFGGGSSSSTSSTSSYGGSSGSSSGFASTSRRS